MGDAKDNHISSICMEELVEKHSSNIWNLVLAFLMWLIWQKHSTNTFKDMRDL